MENNESSIDKEKMNELVQVPSIGRLTARALISDGFKSITDLEEADLEELKGIPHLGEKKAERIYEDLHGEEEEKEEIENEFECPHCSNFISIEEKRCGECKEPVRIRGGVVLPDRGILESPKRILAETDKKIMDGGKDPNLWFIRGSILESMGANEQALDAYDKVIELDPLFEHIWNAKAAVSLKVGKPKEAAKAYKVALNAHDPPVSMMDVPEKPSKAKAPEDMPEESEESKKAEKKITKARDHIENISDEDLDLTTIRLKLDKATDARLDGEFEKAVDEAENVIKECEKAKKFFELIQEAKSRLEELEEKEKVGHEEYEEVLEGIKSSTGKVDYHELVQKIKDLLDKMEKIKEKEEDMEEKVEQKIEKAKSILRDRKESIWDLDRMKKNLREGIKKRELSDDKEAIERLEKVISDGMILLKCEELKESIEDKLDDLIEEVKEFDLKVDLDHEEELVNRVKEDLKQTIKLSEKGEYERVKRWLNKIAYALEFEKEKLDDLESVKDSLDERISEVEELKSELSDEVIELANIEEAISEAEETLKRGNHEKGIETLDDFIVDGVAIKKISDNLEAIDSNIDELKKYEDIFDKVETKDIEERIEDAKNHCEQGQYDEAVIESEEVLEDIENETAKYSKRAEKEIEHLKDEIEDMIEESKEKKINIFSDEFLKELENLKKEENKYSKVELLKQITSLKEKGDLLLRFKSKVSLIEDRVEEMNEKIDKDEWAEKIDDLKEEFEKRDPESAISKCDELEEELQKIEELSEKEPEVDIEDKFEKAKKRLSDLRQSELGLGKMKSLVKKANKARKKKKEDKASEFIDKSLEVSDELAEMNKLVNDIEQGIEEHKDEEHFDEKIYRDEIKKLQRATKFGLYETPKRLLVEIKKELENEDYKRKKVEEMEDPTVHIKKKISEVKDLHSFVEESGLDVQIGKQHLKEAVAKIKDKEYEEVLDILSKGEKDLLEDLENELKSEVKELEERLEDTDTWKANKRWMNIFKKEVKSRLKIGDHREAVSIFGELTDYLDSLEEMETEKEKHIFTIEKKLDHFRDFGIDIEEEESLLKEARGAEELERTDMLIGRIRDGLTEKIRDKIKDDIFEIDKELFSEERSLEENTELVDHLTKAEWGRRKEHLERMIFHWSKYLEQK